MTRVLLRPAFLVLAALAVLTSAASPAAAQASLVVDTAADGPDDGECAVDCTLREALSLLDASGTITFDAALDGATIALTQGQLQITRPLTVDASALTSGLTVDAQRQEQRVIDVTPGTASGAGAVLIGLTITGGKILGGPARPAPDAPNGARGTGPDRGAGIRNTGQLRLERSTLTGNRGDFEGNAIWSSGTLTLLRTTVANNPNADTGNDVPLRLHEVYLSGGTFVLQSSTLSDDGIWNEGGTATVEASTLIGEASHSAFGGHGGSLTVTSSVASEIQGCTGTTVSHSLIEDGSCITPGVDGNLSGDPILGALADNGGPTLTHLPQAASPLLDAGDPAGCPATDQRGEPRPLDGDDDGTATCDIGAVEGSADPIPPISLVVDTAVDEADDGECDVDCTLREAIALANAHPTGGTITFAPSVTGTINLTGALPDLSREVTIQGPGADVLTVRRDTGGRYTIFTIASGSVVAISGLTITNGDDNFGGGISNSGALTVTNITITGNAASGAGGGGGILNEGTLTVTGSTIAGNTARTGGGISNGGTMTVTGSTITSNTASIGGGGIDSPGTLMLDSSTITGNTANGDLGGEGGGLWNSGDSAQATLRNSIVAGNLRGTDTPDDVANSGTVTSEGYNLIGEDGEGLFAATGDQTGTVAAPLDAGLGPLQDNGGPTLTHLPRRSSPAIDAGDTALTSDQRGTARPQDGTDDIGAVERSSTDGLTLVVDTAADKADDGECASDCTLREALALAQANPDGGTITFAGSVTGTITLSSALPDLTSDLVIQGPGAGALAVDGGGASRVFTIATSGFVAISGLTVSGGSADDGGGIYNSGTLTLDSSAVSGNTATGDDDGGGGIYNEGTLTVSRSTISGNTVSGTTNVSGDGGGIFNRGTLAVNTSTISGNTAGSDGGGVLNFGTLTLHKSTITSNTANRGGGIFDSFGTLTVGGSIVADNVSNSASSPNIAKIGPFTSEGYNLIGDSNGAFDATGDRINLSARLGPLQDNGGPTLTHLPQGGSAIYGGDPATCSGLDQRGLPRPDPVAGVCDIGAVERQDPPPFTLVVDTTDDEADDGECDDDCTLREALLLVPYGGTITFDASVTGTINLRWALPDLSNVTVQGPGADVLEVRGGGGSIFTVPSGRTVAISGLTISGGRGGEGGGILNGGTLTLTRSTVSGNTNGVASSTEGGGIKNGGTMTIQSSTISGNESGSGGGGGILNGGTLTIIGSTISGNTDRDGSSLTDGGGGGIKNGGALTIINSTIVGNTVTGTGTASDPFSGGILNDGGTLTLRNSIVAGNFSSGTPDDIERNGGTVTSEGYNLVGEDGEGLFAATGDQTGTVAAPLDAGLGPLQDNGGPTPTHLPTLFSPVVDAGDPGCSDTDQRGQPRPFPTSGPCDIGAVEVQRDLVTQQLSGAEGYRMLASPETTTIGEFLDAIWTQGYPGSDGPAGACSVFVFDETVGSLDGGWTCVGDASDPLAPGDGVMVYVYEDDDFTTPDIQGGFPKTLPVPTTAALAPFSAFGLTYTDNDDTPAYAEGWNLLGNPLASAFSWEESEAADALARTVYVFDPNYLGGDYRVWTRGVGGDLPDGVVPQNQGFLVHALGSGPSLTIPAAAVVGTDPEVYGRPASASGPLRLALATVAPDGTETPVSVAFVAPTEGAALGLDALDALRLTPTAWPRTVLSTYPLGEPEPVPLSLNALPADAVGEITVPLDVAADGHEAGALALHLSWTGALPDGWTAALLDREAGTETPLAEGGGYHFALDVQGRAARSAHPAGLSAPGPTTAPRTAAARGAKTGGTEPGGAATTGDRFALVLTPATLAPTFALGLVPDDPSGTIGEGGGRVSFVATAANETAGRLTQEAWLVVTDPTGASTTRALGSVALPASASGSKQLRIRVRPSSPAGEYRVSLYAGEEQGEPLASASFTFEKAGSAFTAKNGGAGVEVETEGAWVFSDGPAAGAARAAFGLAAPVPNPSRGSVRLGYALAEAGAVRLAVFDALGREVAVLEDGARGAGAHEAVLDAGALAPGAYVVRLTSPSGVAVRTLTVVR